MNTKNIAIEEMSEITEMVPEESINDEPINPESDFEIPAEDESNGLAMAAGVIIVAAVTAACAARKLIRKHRDKKKLIGDGEVCEDKSEYRTLTMSERMTALFTGKVRVYPYHKEDNEG